MPGRLLFNGVELPASAVYLDVAATLSDGIPEETSRWFWHFSICRGVLKQEKSSVVLTHTGQLLSCLQPGVSIEKRLATSWDIDAPLASVVVEEWVDALRSVMKLAGQKKICTWVCEET